MNAEVIGLTVYQKRGEPGIPQSELDLLEGLGVEGDSRQGGTRQVSLLSAEARCWMEAQSEKGLCFDRFHENILLKGFPMESLTPGVRLSAGSAVLRISERKECFPECTLVAKGALCRLSRCAVFAVVEQGGRIRIKDSVSILR